MDLLFPTRVSQVTSYACEQALLCEFQRYPVSFMLAQNNESDLTQEDKEIESSKLCVYISFFRGSKEQKTPRKSAPCSG